MNDDELFKLDFCAKKLGLSAADVIRQGIEIMYENAKKRNKQAKRYQRSLFIPHTLPGAKSIIAPRPLPLNIFAGGIFL